MINILEMHLDDLWDDRHWHLALKSDDPTKTYAEMRETFTDLKSGVSIEDLPPEQQAWYRST